MISSGFNQTAINFINFIKRNRQLLNGRNYFNTLYSFKNFNSKNNGAISANPKRTDEEMATLKRRYQKIYSNTKLLKIVAIIAIFMLAIILVIINML